MPTVNFIDDEPSKLLLKDLRSYVAPYNLNEITGRKAIKEFIKELVKICEDTSQHYFLIDADMPIDPDRKEILGIPITKKRMNGLSLVDGLVNMGIPNTRIAIVSHFPADIEEEAAIRNVCFFSKFNLNITTMREWLQI